MARNKRDDPNPNGDKAVRQKTAARGRTSARGVRMPVAAAKTAEAPAAGAQALLRRVVIEGVRPEVDEGRFPAKGVIGASSVVEADIYADGSDAIAADVLYRCSGAEAGKPRLREAEAGKPRLHEGDGSAWTRVPMQAMVNDRWRAHILISQMTSYVFTIEAWIDHFGTWQRDLARKVEAGQDVALDLLAGARLIEEALPRVLAKDAEALRKAAATLVSPTAAARRVEAALAAGLGSRMRDAADMRLATRYRRELRIEVDGPKAAYSTWYEMFPRSASADPKRPGTFRDVEARLPYVAGMGFDVLYLPPVHPIGRTKRKGANNAGDAKAGDPGSPWAIGSQAGGHKSVDPALGTLDDFRRLVSKAKDRGLDVALDIAFQCSPDHPYVHEHPEWFRLRPDGSVQFAENPPKKYEDIYPFDFETPARESLWQELLSVFLFWMEQGVGIFRVDNPHTKPFAFWEWLIAQVHTVDPRVILLAEAFTRPKIMYHLAKLGFTQSYTYFTWRPDKAGLTEYFTELTQTGVADFFRPNVWPNTPDILTEQMQSGGRPAFVSRLVLAATLSANYGIYGPPFELGEHEPREPGTEEYLHSEKYEQRHWEVDRADSLRDLIALVNMARRENEALQSNRGLRFHAIENGQLIAYSKQTDDASNVVICVVNLDPTNTQSGVLWLPIEEWGLRPDEPYQVHDLLSDARYTWQGASNFVQLNPQVIPAHVLRLRRRVGATGWEFE